MTQAKVEDSLAAGPPLIGVPVEATLAVRVSGLEPAMVEVLKATLCAKFSHEQFLLFLAMCRKKGADPFTEAYGFPNDEGGACHRPADRRHARPRHEDGGGPRPGRSRRSSCRMGTTGGSFSERDAPCAAGA